MILITNNSDLRKHIPNVFAEVDDEVFLYDKLLPWLESSEQWLQDNIVGDILDAIPQGTPLFGNMQAFVVADALRSAIPSLDLVLTPNGFGVVSTNAIAPASKERVERLIISLTVRKDRMISVILSRIRTSCKDWHSTAQCEWLSQSLIQDYNIVLQEAEYIKDKDGNPDRWLEFCNYRNECLPWQEKIAQEWISPELMQRLCRDMATGTIGCGAFIVRQLIEVLRFARRYSSLPENNLFPVINYIRHYPDAYPEWHSSETAKLFGEIHFRNKKTSPGYFF